jgi:Glycosyl transferases group 1
MPSARSLQGSVRDRQLQPNRNQKTKTERRQPRTVLVIPSSAEAGGTRLKILEEAACGKGIVSTSVGAEGLNFQHEREMLISDSAPEFSEAVIRPCTDEGLRQDLGSAAHPVALDLDWEASPAVLHTSSNPARCRHGEPRRVALDFLLQRGGVWKSGQGRI